MTFITLCSAELQIKHSTVNLIEYHYIFLLVDCYEPRDRANLQFLILVNGASVNGRYREGTEAYYTCELGYGSGIIQHPSICQANGTWTLEEACEGKSYSKLDCTFSFETK